MSKLSVMRYTVFTGYRFKTFFLIKRIKMNCYYLFTEKYCYSSSNICQGACCFPTTGATCDGGTEPKAKFFQPTKTQCTTIYAPHRFLFHSQQWPYCRQRADLNSGSKTRWRKNWKLFHILSGMEHLHGNVHIC